MENNNILDYVNLSESGLTKSEIQQLYSYDTQQINIEQIEQIKVNVIILVKNQEKLIRKAIDSVLSIADNIYVFDTGSTDGTKKVVASYPEKVHLSEKEWVEDYSYMRNYAMKNITEGEWIFIIDSDESLKTKFSQLEFKIMLYLLDCVANLKNIVLTIRQESQENSIVGYPQRIFKKNSNLNFYGVVHEELRAPIIKNISTEITLHNLGTATEEVKKFDKVKRYNNLLLKNIQDEPLYIKWFALLDYDFGKENLPDYHKKMDYFCNLIQKNKSNIACRDDVFEMTLLAKKIYDNILNQKFDEAKKNIEFSINYFEENSIFYTYKYLAEIYYMQSKYDSIFRSIKSDIYSLKQKDISRKTPPLVQLDTRILEELVAKILFKMEKYDVAVQLIVNKDLADINITKPERDFLEKLIGD